MFTKRDHVKKLCFVQRSGLEISHSCLVLLIVTQLFNDIKLQSCINTNLQNSTTVHNILYLTSRMNSFSFLLISSIFKKFIYHVNFTEMESTLP